MILRGTQTNKRFLMGLYLYRESGDYRTVRNIKNYPLTEGRLRSKNCAILYKENRICEADTQGVLCALIWAAIEERQGNSGIGWRTEGSQSERLCAL